MKRILHFGHTGIRSGETLVATPHSKQNSGSEITVRLSDRTLAVPPSSKYVDSLEYSDVRDGIHEIAFFSKMTTKQAIQWIENNKQQGDIYISAIPDIEIKFHSISGTDMMRMPEDVRSNLLQFDGYVKLREIYHHFNKPGSKSNLIFRPNNWMIKVDSETSFEGTLLTLTDTAVTMSYHSGVLEDASISADIAIRYAGSDDVAVYGDYIVASELTDMLREVTTPSLHKSIIQKIIRTRTATISFLGAVLTGKEALLTSIAMLCQHPGILNTNIHPPVFETGLQSALKRLAVSVAEDSYTSAGNLLFLLTAGLYAKLNRTWTPSAQFIDRMMQIAVDAHKEERCFKYDISANHTARDNTYGLCLDLLTSLGSLKTDLPMFASISYNKGATLALSSSMHRVNVSLAHAVDMHNITDIAWFVPRSLIVTYPDFFRQVWQQSSSANPRKEILLRYSKLVEQLVLAQTLALYIRIYSPVNRLRLGTERAEIEHTLHPSWFAATLGPVSMKLPSGRQANIILNTSNMNDMHVTVIPNLSRGEKEYTVTEKDISAATKHIAKLLASGVRASKRTLSLVDSIYYVDDVAWEDYAIRTTRVALCEPMQHDVINACLFSGPYIEEDYLDSIDALVASLTTAESSRVLLYLSSYSTSIELRKIDRRGGSANYQVSPDDTSVFHFLCSLCVICPCALVLTPAYFQVMNTTAFMSIRNYILNLLRSSNARSVTSKQEDSDWPAIDVSQVQLYPHQESALSQCIASHNGKSIINMTPGLGKTRIMIHYIASLIDRGLMTKYCIYTLPPSAMKGVIDQFLEYDIECNVLDYASSSKTYNPNIYSECVNFIKHDHMRLGSFMQDSRELVSSLFFVVDEFHLTLLDTTQRTSDALELATSARYTVAMTGTMIHNKMELLVPWLKLICQFEVTSKNFLVAVGEVISSRIVTGISVVRKSYDIPLSSKQLEEHNSSFENALRLCYKLINEEIVKLALSYIKAGTSVFIVAKDISAQEWLRDQLLSAGIRAIDLITSTNPIDYKPNTKPKLDAIITTSRHSTGYTITGMHTMITSVYFGSQASREQLDMRLNRIGQPSKVLTYITIHCGILTRVMERYDRIKSVADAMKEFASIVGL
ncbi:Hypothetical protein POVR2_LOCUS307 [uncultured virus]|nr:Hypothetical protein POVR2_LOCUS307 [uncultured virus]